MRLCDGAPFAFGTVETINDAANALYRQELGNRYNAMQAQWVYDRTATPERFLEEAKKAVPTVSPDALEGMVEGRI